MTQGVIRRYTFKLYPNQAQAKALDDMRRLHCALYNAALQERIDAYRLGNGARSWLEWQAYRPIKRLFLGKTLTHFDQCKSIKVIRAEDPAYEAISADSMGLTLKRLDLAYQAFFRRAKAGAGFQSGFPRYKRSDEYPGFTHRPGQGWRFDVRPDKKSGKTTIKGIPGAVKWRGKFPMFPYGIKTGDVMLRAGVWWLSVVADMPARMRADADHSGEVEFDLVDNFARVSCADGRHDAGPKETVYAAANGRIIPVVSRVCAEVPPADALQTEGERGGLGAIAVPDHPADALQTEGARGNNVERFSGHRPADALQTEDERGDYPAEVKDGMPADTSQTKGDRGEETLRNRPTDTPQTVMSRCKRGSCKYRAAKRRHARQAARKARQRREALHVWTTRIARRFGHVAIIRPPIAESTASGAGDSREWGAAVALKAELNRHVLDQAPAMAVAMLEYKIAERGGSTTITEPPDPAVAVGNLIVAATKANRKLRRTAANA